jgi:phycoerythrobilin:ferredoxin oxidoreductase
MTLYEPFLNSAIEILRSRLNLDPYPIPAGYEFKEAVTGKGARETVVTTTSHAFQTDKLRQIRAAHVQGGGALQVLNFVIFPRLNYDLPFFGGDLVTLPGGHLIAIDMQPLFHDDAYRAKYADPIMPTFQKYQALLPWGGDFPEEAKPFFSPAFLKQYLDYVDAAEPVTDPDRLAAIRTAQLKYLQYRAEKDPARGMFQRFYGPEWTEEYIHGFLFDLERHLT